MLAPLAPFNSLFERTEHSQSPARSNTLLSGGGIKKHTRFSGSIHQRDSFELFNSILQKAYSKIAFKPGNISNPLNQSDRQVDLSQYNPANFQSVDKISSNQAAGTILGFITGRIRSDEANGASQDELLERLDQGLQGFIKGFNEAKDVIEGLGLLTPGLSEEINDTYALVTRGIEQLRNGITGELPDSSQNNEVVSTSRLSRASLSTQISQSSSFSLSLTTQDGDRVTIEVSRSSQTSFSATFEQNSNRSSLSINGQSSSESSFSLNVIGQLDQDELTAINQLLQDVDAIADDFFNGRLDQAFEQALNLNINSEELSSLNLQLKKTTTVQALAAYQSNSQNSFPIPNNSALINSPFADITQLLERLENIVEESKKFSKPFNLLESISAGISRTRNAGNGHEDNNLLGNNLKTLISQFGLE